MTTMLHHMKKTGALLCVPLLLVIGCTDGTITVQERQQGPGENTVDPNKPGSPGNPSNPNNPGNPTEPGNPTDPTRMKPGEIVPGRVTIRRLNRAEYNNTVRDLLWTQSEPANEFPADDYGYGFNNIGDTLTVSPLLMELYEKSADALVEEVFASRGSDGKSERFEAEVIQGSVGAARGEFWNLYSNGEVIQRTETTARGTYTISARAYGTQAGGEPAKMAFLMDGKAIKEVDVPVESGNPMVYSAQVDVEPGQHFFGVAFTNDFYDAAAGADRNLYVDWIEVTSPMQAPGEKSPWTRIMVCEDETPACAGQIFSTFGRRAWRRPMKQAEVDRLVQFLDVAKDNQLSFEEGVALGLKAMLLSPHFIFRPELDRAEIGEVHDINAHELATRLAYFLWSSTPDDTLLALAESGEILKEDVLRAQVERMLGDERANSLVSNYAAQWLYTDAVLDAQPDTTLFPDYNKQLAQDFRTEARMFAADFLLQDRDYRELLTGKYTYLNKRLADHYEIEGVEGDEFRRYEFTGDQRRGVLTQGGLLTARAYPNRTSPVLRGVWVMEEILCSEPPPPPSRSRGD